MAVARTGAAAFFVCGGAACLRLRAGLPFRRGYVFLTLVYNGRLLDWGGERRTAPVPRGVGYPAGNAYLCGVSNRKILLRYGKGHYRIMENCRYLCHAVGGGAAAEAAVRCGG